MVDNALKKAENPEAKNKQGAPAEDPLTTEEQRKKAEEERKKKIEDDVPYLLIVAW